MNLEFLNNYNLSEKIYKAWEEKETKQTKRDYLGISSIGNKCDRYLWLLFRQAFKQTFPGRILRLFNRGHREEEIVYNDLKMLGCQIEGDQYESTYGTFIKGHCDGVVLGLPEREKTRTLLEIKTIGDKYYKKYIKDGLEKTNIVYYTQMQSYMYLMGLTRGLFFAVNKNTDEIYTEIIKIDKAFAIKQLERADRITTLKTPPNGISDNPISWWECRFCNAREVCSKMSYPVKNCKTCCFSTPTKQGWICEHGEFGEACGKHLYIPSLISDVFEMKDDGCIYHNIDGKIIINAPVDEFPKITDKNIHDII